MSPVVELKDDEVVNYPLMADQSISQSSVARVSCQVSAGL